MKTPIAVLLPLLAALCAPVCGFPAEFVASKPPGEKSSEARSPEAPPVELQPSPGERQIPPNEALPGEAGQQPARPPGEFPLPPETGAEEGGRHRAKLDPIAEEYLTEAGVLLDEGDVVGALTALLRARARSPRNRKVERGIKEITGSMHSEAYYSPEPLQLGKGISSPLQFLLTYENGAQAAPVAGMPVDFDFVKGGGVLTGKAITNDLGIAKCYVESVTEAAEGVLIRGKVTLGVDVLEDALDQLTRTYEFSSFSIFDAPHALLVSGDETHTLPDDVPPAVCTAVEALFTSKGFARFGCGAVSHPSLFRRAMELERPAVRLLGDELGAKVLLLMDVRAAFLSQPSPDFHFFSASLTMKIIDVESFHLYFESTKEERGAGPTSDQAERQAVENALARLSVDLESYLGTLR